MVGVGVNCVKVGMIAFVHYWKREREREREREKTLFLALLSYTCFVGNWCQLKTNKNCSMDKLFVVVVVDFLYLEQIDCRLCVFCVVYELKSKSLNYFF